MSTIVRCDRCGRTFPPSATFRLRLELNPAAALSAPAVLPVRDLCRPCLDELRTWLAGEENRDG